MDAIGDRLNHDPAGFGLILMVFMMISGFGCAHAVKGVVGLTFGAIGRAIVDMVVQGLLQN